MFRGGEPDRAHLGDHEHDIKNPKNQFGYLALSGFMLGEENKECGYCDSQLDHPQKSMKELQTLNHSVHARDGSTRQVSHVS